MMKEHYRWLITGPSVNKRKLLIKMKEERCCPGSNECSLSAKCNVKESSLMDNVF